MDILICMQAAGGLCPHSWGSYNGIGRVLFHPSFCLWYRYHGAVRNALWQVKIAAKRGPALHSPAGPEIASAIAIVPHLYM